MLEVDACRRQPHCAPVPVLYTTSLLINFYRAVQGFAAAMCTSEAHMLLQNEAAGHRGVSESAFRHPALVFVQS